MKSKQNVMHVMLSDIVPGTLTQKREIGLMLPFTIDLKCDKCGHPRRTGK